MRKFRGSVIALALVAVVAVIAAGCGSSSSSSSSSSRRELVGLRLEREHQLVSVGGKPILIGAGDRLHRVMAPTDEPALYGAEIEINKINAPGRRGRPQDRVRLANTQLKPAQTRSDALNLV